METSTTNRTQVAWIRPVRSVWDYSFGFTESETFTDTTNAAVPQTGSTAYPTVWVHFAPLDDSPDGVEDPPPGTIAGADSGDVESGGIVYRVPRAVQMVVRVRPPGSPPTDGEVCLRQTIMLAQFGTLASLPNQVRRSGSIDITLSATTGALRRVEFRGRDYTGVAAEAAGAAIERITTPTATLLRPRDPLARDNQELQRLQLDRSLRCLQILGRPCAETEASPAASATSATSTTPSSANSPH